MAPVTVLQASVVQALPSFVFTGICEIVATLFVVVIVNENSSTVPPSPETSSRIIIDQRPFGLSPLNVENVVTFPDASTGL